MHDQDQTKQRTFLPAISMWVLAFLIMPIAQLVDTSSAHLSVQIFPLSVLIAVLLMWLSVFLIPSSALTHDCPYMP